MPAARPEQCNILFGEAVSDGELDTVVAFYEPGATFVSDDGESFTGTEAIREAMAGFLSMKPVLKVEVPLVIESGDTALLYSKWSFSGTTPDGAVVNVEGNGTEVVRKQPGGHWLFVIDNPYGCSLATTHGS